MKRGRLFLLALLATLAPGIAFATCSGAVHQRACTGSVEAYAIAQSDSHNNDQYLCSPNFTATYNLFARSSTKQYVWGMSCHGGPSSPSDPNFQGSGYASYSSDTCSTLADTNVAARAGATPSTCDQGCTTTNTKDGPTYVVVGSNGLPVTWQNWKQHHVAGVCPSSVSPDTDGDGVPDTNDAFPNDPNETTDTDGDGIGDNGDTAPNDPTNGTKPPQAPGTCGGAGQPVCDSNNGSGNGNTSGGGGTCTAAPVSTGDAIAAQVAYQTWATKCAVIAHQALTQATNAKLDAIKAAQAAQATASKQDDAIAQAALTNAKIDELKAIQNAQLADWAKVDTTNAEITATNTKIDALNAQQKTEIDATNAAIAALQGSTSTDGATAHADAQANGGKLDAVSSKLDTVSNWLADINAAMSSQTGTLGDKLDALKTAIEGQGPNVAGGGGTDMTATNAKLNTLHGDLTDTSASSDSTDGYAGHEGDLGKVFPAPETDDATLDQTGFGLSQTCPEPPTITVAGYTRTIDTSSMCDLGDVIRALVILAALAQAAWIIGGNR